MNRPMPSDGDKYLLLASVFSLTMNFLKNKDLHVEYSKYLEQCFGPTGMVGNLDAFLQIVNMDLHKAIETKKGGIVWN